MVLKEQVVFVGGATNASKDGTFHEVVSIGAETVDYL